MRRFQAPVGRRTIIDRVRDRSAGLFDDSGGRLARAYAENIRGRPVEASSLATVAYLVTFVVVRVFLTANRGSASPAVAVDGVHIHHVVVGVIFLLIAGMLALDELFRLPRAVLFGVGAALVLDEFALVVFLRDVYFLPPGLLSGVALAVGLAALAINAWRGRPFLLALGASLRRH